MKTFVSLSLKVLLISGLLMTGQFCSAKNDTPWVPIPKLDPIIPPIMQPNLTTTCNPIENTLNGSEMLINFR
jgi:hypothetical protein